MEIYAQKVPEEVKSDLIAVIKRVEQNKIQANKKDIEYLFKIYHEFLAPFDKQNINCKACRAKVCGVFFSILRLWNKTNKN
jgi:hypothetical protein